MKHLSTRTLKEELRGRKLRGKVFRQAASAARRRTFKHNLHANRFKIRTGVIISGSLLALFTIVVVLISCFSGVGKRKIVRDADVPLPEKQRVEVRYPEAMTPLSESG